MAGELAAVVMAGGLGTRMKSATPKHLHPLLGRRMVDWVIRAAQEAGVERIVVVASPDTAGSFDGVEVAVQQQPLGTGDAVRSARDALDRLEPHNVQGELYITDTLGLLVGDGDPVAVHTAPVAWEVEGINTRAELAEVAAKLRDRINEAHMLAGVTIVDPTTTWIEADVTIEAHATVEPFTVLRGTTAVAGGAVVGPHVVAVDAEIGRDVAVGPFAYLRPGTVLGEA